MKTFKDLKVGDKLFCIDVENLCLMIYEINNIVDSSFPKSSVYIYDHRVFELLTIIGENIGRFSVLQKDLKQSKQDNLWLIFYADEKAAIRQLNVLIKNKERSKK